MPRDWVAAVARLISLQTFYTAIYYLSFISERVHTHTHTHTHTHRQQKIDLEF